MKRRKLHEPSQEQKERIARTLWYDLNPGKVPGGIKGILRPYEPTYEKHKAKLAKAAPGNLEAYGKLPLREAVEQYLDFWWYDDWIVKPPRT